MGTRPFHAPIYFFRSRETASMEFDYLFRPKIACFSPIVAEGLAVAAPWQPSSAQHDDLQSSDRLHCAERKAVSVGKYPIAIEKDKSVRGLEAHSPDMIPTVIAKPQRSMG